MSQTSATVVPAADRKSNEAFAANMLESLNCNSCGAPLEIPASARFFKCNHCNANLQVHRSSSGTFTEAVEKLTEQTEALAEQVERLTEQNEVAEFDRRWDIERESFMIESKNGNRQLPTEGTAWASGIVAVGFGTLWTIFAIAITQSAPSFGPFAVAKVVFPLFGLFFIGFGIFSAMSAHQKSQNYRSAERNYRRRRSELQRGE